MSRTVRLCDLLNSFSSVVLISKRAVGQSFLTPTAQRFDLYGLPFGEFRVG
jgi:hypothetical protein